MQNLIKNWNKDTNVLTSLCLLLFIFFITPLAAQTTQAATMQKDTLQYEEFEMVEGDTTYVMKKYFLLTYLSGEKRDQSKKVAEKKS